MRELLRQLIAWRSRSAPPSAMLDREVATEAHPFFATEDDKIALDGLLKTSFDSGVQAERKRIAEILLLPDATRFPHLAVDLAVGGATAVQVAACLSRAETSVQARLHPTGALESTSSVPTLH